MDGPLDGLPAEGGLVGARLGHQVLGKLVLGLGLEVLLELGQRLGRYGGTWRRMEIMSNFALILKMILLRVKKEIAFTRWSRRHRALCCGTVGPQSAGHGDG